MLLIFFLLLIIFLYIIGKRNGLFGNIKENFGVYNIYNCDTYNQPCMASRKWTYINGYYYPI